MTLRLATAADDHEVLRMALQFLASSTYRDQVTKDAAHLQQLVTWLRDEQLLLVLEDEAGELVGMLGMAIVPSLMSGEPIAYEAAWWLAPERRGSRWAVRLWERAEAWAEEKGAAAIQMIAPAHSDVGSLYARRGYAPLETTWQKRVA